MQRLNDLRGKFASGAIDGLLVGSEVNRRYLSGFTAGWLVISAKKAMLAVDFRYVEQAKQESTGFEISYIKGDMAGWLPEMLKSLGINNLGIESDHTSLATYESLCSILKSGEFQINTVPSKNLVESLRIIKNQEEIRHISRAADIADQAMSYVGSNLRAGVSELQFAWELERFIRDLKYEPLPFDIIVASGQNAALPHAKPSDKLISGGEPVTIDLGARYNGYCSDITRTFVIGEGDEAFYKVYNVVLGAQLSALSIIEAGMKATDADGIARKLIEKAGYGEHFGHGLGHGIGLETHEAPRLGTLSDDILLDNMVFTIEPGVYLPGWGGIRIEDTVTLKDGKLKMITKAGKEARVHGG